MHQIEATAAGDAVGTLGSGTTSITGIGPYVTGSGTWSRGASTTTGPVTGDLIAHFDSIGDVPVPADTWYVSTTGGSH